MNSEQKYSNREIDGIIKLAVTPINDRLKNQDESLARIEKQVSYTNGKVKNHEKILWLVTGGMIVIGWLLTNNFIHCLGKICQQ